MCLSTVLDIADLVFFTLVYLVSNRHAEVLFFVPPGGQQGMILKVLWSIEQFKPRRMARR